MDRKDIQTIVITKRADGAYIKAIEQDWLKYLGFTEKEFSGDEIILVVQADYSKRYGQPFIGIAKKK